METVAKSEDGEEISQIPTRDTKLRWLMLVFGSFFLFGSCVAYDIPSSLSIYLQD